MSSEITPNQLFFYLNGRKHILTNPDPEMTLLNWLRYEKKLTGTKFACGEGGCGACTVCVASWHPEESKVHYKAINACLTPLCTMDRAHIITVEGLSDGENLHPIQRKMVELHGSQCGYCTPGFVMSMYSFLRENPNPTALEAEGCLSGNLCRCTGHPAILDVVKTFTTDAAAWPPGDSFCSCSAGLSCGGDCKKYNNLSTSSTSSSSPKSSGCHCKSKSKATVAQSQVGSGCCKSKSGKVSSSSASSSCCSTSEKDPSKQCCKSKGSFAKYNMRPFLQHSDSFSLYSRETPYTEMFFPAKLKHIPKRSLSFSCIKTDNEKSIPIEYKWFHPISLAELVTIRQEYPKAKFLIGATEIGVHRHIQNYRPETIVHVDQVPELVKWEDTAEHLSLGSSTTWASLEQICHTLIDKYEKAQESYKIGHLKQFLTQIELFAGNQVRNIAGIGGNIMNGSPISDFNALWMALDSTVVLYNFEEGTASRVKIRNFYTGYRKTVTKPTQFLLSIEVPWLSKNEYFNSFKVSKRKEDDIAIVNAGMKVALKNNENNIPIVSDISLVYGGMSFMMKECKVTQSLLLNKSWNNDLLNIALDSLAKELKLNPDVPGGFPDFRQTVALSFFYRFYSYCSSQIGDIDPKNISAIDSHTRTVTSSYQSFPDNTSKGSAIPSVHAPLTHASGFLHVTGRAKFTSDTVDGCYFAAPVLTSVASGIIVSVDPSDALSTDGVIDFISATDVPGHNIWGSVIKDDPIFAEQTVLYQGQLIGLVVAKSDALAQLACRDVKVTYKPTEPPILTIQDAIKKNSFHGTPHSIIHGDVEAGFAESEYVFSDYIRIGGQEHFYLETQSATAIPGENDEMTVWSSNQNCSETAHVISEALKISTNKVAVKVKRLGGGFGGKETRACPIATNVAVAAKKLGYPVHMTLTRQQDMNTTGMRHSFEAQYKVGFNGDGKIVALDVDTWANCGATCDLSLAVIDRCLFHLDNCASINNVKFRGFGCKTNILSATAFRSFGGVQAIFIHDSILDSVCAFLNEKVHKKCIADNLSAVYPELPVPTYNPQTKVPEVIDYPFPSPSEKHHLFYPEFIKQINMYSTGDFIPCGQKLTNWHIPRMWSELYSKSDYAKRHVAIQEFNKNHTWKKRGISMHACKFGIAFTAVFLNQGGCLVHVYTDGSVLITHGGVEMGQGLHTKMIQIASQELSVPVSDIHISETATDKVANSTSSAASSCSDLYGMAVLKACQQLNVRLNPLRSQLKKKFNRDPTMSEIANTAFLSRLDLTEHGYYQVPLKGYDFDTGEGTPFNYFTTGCAVSEVEVDVLTGEFNVVRTDILMDLGKSLNPAIDIGQIQGAFIQGLGLFTMEQALWLQNGNQLTVGPSTYKIPAANDVPDDLRVHLLTASTNPNCVHSSKAVGEPPLLLGSSVFFGIKEALYSSRLGQPVPKTGFFRLDSPATVGRIRMSAGDNISSRFILSPENAKKTWCIET